eukprot:7707120-Pyramimonas_sp.AAC.1
MSVESRTVAVYEASSAKYDLHSSVSSSFISPLALQPPPRPAVRSYLERPCTAIDEARPVESTPAQPENCTRVGMSAS